MSVRVQWALINVDDTDEIFMRMGEPFEINIEELKRKYFEAYSGIEYSSSCSKEKKIETHISACILEPGDVVVLCETEELNVVTSENRA